jgi:hypothetical protein
VRSPGVHTPEFMHAPRAASARAKPEIRKTFILFFMAFPLYEKTRRIG